MSKICRISILVILVVGVVIGLFIKFRVGNEQKQTDAANQSALSSPEPKTELSAKKESEEVLPTLMLITTTEACSCTLTRCQEAESIVGKIIKQFSGKVDYKVIDYAKETEKVNKLARQYKLGFLPALLFFDSNGNYTRKIEGFLHEEDVVEELSSLGGSTE